MKATVAAIAILTLLSACSDIKKSRPVDSYREAERKAEQNRASFAKKFPGAVQIDSKEVPDPTRKFTIDFQDTIATRPLTTYWCEVEVFDVARVRGVPRLTARCRHDQWLSLECTEEAVGRLRKLYDSPRTSRSYALLFRLASAAPMQVELKAETRGEEREYAEVVADDLRGRLYTGNLVEFDVIDEGMEPID